MENNNNHTKTKSKLFLAAILVAPIFFLLSWFALIGYEARLDALADTTLYMQRALAHETRALWAISDRVDAHLRHWKGSFAHKKLKKILKGIQPEWVKYTLMMSFDGWILNTGTSNGVTADHYDFFRTQIRNLDLGKWTVVSNAIGEQFLMYPSDTSIVIAHIDQKKLSKALVQQVLDTSFNRKKYIEFAQAKLMSPAGIGIPWHPMSLDILPHGSSWDRLAILDDANTTGVLAVGWKTVPFLLDFGSDMFAKMLRLSLFWGAIYSIFHVLQLDNIRSIRQALSSSFQSKLSRYRLNHTVRQLAANPLKPYFQFLEEMTNPSHLPYKSQHDVLSCIEKTYEKMLTEQGIGIQNKLTSGAGDDEFCLNSFALILAYLVDNVVSNDYEQCTLIVSNHKDGGIIFESTASLKTLFSGEDESGKEEMSQVLKLFQEQDIRIQIESMRKIVISVNGSVLTTRIITKGNVTRLR